MRIGKPLLITTTAIGLPIGIYEAFSPRRFAGLPDGGAGRRCSATGIAWIVRIVRAEQRAERRTRGAPD